MSNHSIRPSGSPLRHLARLASAVLDILETKVCGDMDLTGCVLLAGFAAIVIQPLVYGTLVCGTSGSSIVALMTPVR